MTTAKDYDNRDAAEMYAYLEDRIESMKRRIEEDTLEKEQLKRHIRELEHENTVKSQIIEELAQRLDYNANLGAVGGE